MERRNLLIFIDNIAKPNPVMAFGLEIAQALNFNAVLVDVAHVPVDLGAKSFFLNSQEGSVPADMQEVLEFHKKAMRDLGDQARLIWPHTQVDVELGFAVTELAKLVQKLNPVLVITARRTESSRFDEVFGSLATSLVDGLECPVFVLPKNYEWREPRRIMYLLSDNDELKKLELLQRFNHAFGGDILLVTESDETVPGYDAKHSSIMSMMKSLFGPGQVKYKTIAQKEASRILEIQEEKIADWIICPKVEVGFFSRLFANVPERKIILNADVPVLTV